MGNTFARKSAVEENLTLEGQLQQRKEYFENLKAQLSVKCKDENIEGRSPRIAPASIKCLSSSL